MPFDDKLWLRENTQEIENLKRYEGIFSFWRRKSFLASKPMMSQGRTCLTSAVYFMKIKRKSLKLLKNALFFPLYSEVGLKSSLILTAVFISVSGPNSLLEFTVTCWSCIMTDLLIYWLHMVKMYPLTGKTNIPVVTVMYKLFYILL